MSAAVDVLAVMDAAARDLAIHRPEGDDAAHGEMVIARAAVAELLASHDESDAALTALAEAERRAQRARWLDDDCNLQWLAATRRCAEARDRFDVAIANCNGRRKGRRS